MWDLLGQYRVRGVTTTPKGAHSVDGVWCCSRYDLVCVAVLDRLRIHHAHSWSPALVDIEVSGHVKDVCWSPHDKTLAWLDDKGVVVFDYESCQEVCRHSVRASNLCWTSRGSSLGHVLVAGGDAGAWLWRDYDFLVGHVNIPGQVCLGTTLCIVNDKCITSLSSLDLGSSELGELASVWSSISRIVLDISVDLKPWSIGREALVFKCDLLTELLESNAEEGTANEVLIRKLELGAAGVAMEQFAQQYLNVRQIERLKSRVVDPVGEVITRLVKTCIPNIDKLVEYLVDLKIKSKLSRYGHLGIDRESVMNMVQTLCDLRQHYHSLLVIAMQSRKKYEHFMKWMYYLVEYDIELLDSYDQASVLDFLKTDFFEDPCIVPMNVCTGLLEALSNSWSELKDKPRQSMEQSWKVESEFVFPGNVDLSGLHQISSESGVISMFPTMAEELPLTRTGVTPSVEVCKLQIPNRTYLACVLCDESTIAILYPNTELAVYEFEFQHGVTVVPQLVKEGPIEGVKRRIAAKCALSISMTRGLGAFLAGSKQVVLVDFDLDPLSESDDDDDESSR